MAKIELQGVRHSYDNKKWVLGPLECLFEKHKRIALLGPSGCGKTTLLKILSGLITPSEGKILFDGKDVTKLGPKKRKIAQVFQFPVVYDTMTVYENLAFPLLNYGMGAVEIKKRVEEMGELLELSDHFKEGAKELSPHIKQLVSLGRGLVRKDVSAVLFDEPLTAVSPRLKSFLRKKLKEIHAELELSFLYVTHDQTEALTFAEEVVVMKEGRVLQQGCPRDLFENPKTSFVGHFIGTPGMNFLNYKIEKGRVTPMEVTPHIESYFKNLENGGSPKEGGGALGVRPQHVGLNLEPCLLNDWVWKVKKVDYHGASQLLTLEQESFSIKAVLEGRHSIRHGDRVGVEFPLNKVSLFPGESL